MSHQVFDLGDLGPGRPLITNQPGDIDLGLQLLTGYLMFSQNLLTAPLQFAWNPRQIPDQATAQFPQLGTYFYVGRTAGGTEVYDIAFYGFSRTFKDAARGCTCCRMVYWRAGCRHGTASLERNAMLSNFGLADRRHLLWETREEAFAKLPEHEKTLWGKRVFHPEPSAWHPKNSQGTSNGLALQSSRIRIPPRGPR
jgi:hypothetical protein